MTRRGVGCSMLKRRTDVSVETERKTFRWYGEQLTPYMGPEWPSYAKDTGEPKLGKGLEGNKEEVLD